MVSLRKFFASGASIQPYAGTLPSVTAPTNVVSLAEKRAAKGLSALSSPGVVHFSGYLIHPDERDSAWADQLSRDQTITEMSNNPILGGVLRQIAMFIRQVPWTLEPANDSDEARKIRDWYQEQLDGMDNLWPGETMPQILTFLTWGWSALEIIYKRLPSGGIGWKEWRLIPQTTRYGWRFDDNGEATALVQLDPNTFKEIAIPLERVLHIKDTSRSNSPEGFTLLRIAYDAYFYRTGFQQLEGTLFERFGGVQVARLPGDDIENESDAYRELKQIVTTLGVNAQTGLVLASDKDPATGDYYQDFKIESPASGATVPSADPIITRYANEMVGVFGAGVTRTGQDGSGSYALADVQSKLFLRNMEAYLDLIGDNIENQCFPRLAAMPYNDIPLELIPKLKHGRLDEIDIGDLGAYLVSLAQAGIITDTPEVREYVHDRAALPVPPVDQIKKLMAEEERKKELASQQKINPLQSQRGNSTPPPKGVNADSQSTRQDAVPDKTKTS